MRRVSPFSGTWVSPFSGTVFCFWFGPVPSGLMLAERDAVPLQEVHRRHVLHALAGGAAHIGHLGQAPVRRAAFAVDAEATGADHNDEAVVLKLAEPAADLACARADFLHRLALREIDVARMFF